MSEGKRASKDKIERKKEKYVGLHCQQKGHKEILERRYWLCILVIHSQYLLSFQLIGKVNPVRTGLKFFFLERIFLIVKKKIVEPKVVKQSVFLQVKTASL